MIFDKYVNYSREATEFIKKLPQIQSITVNKILIQFAVLITHIEEDKVHDVCKNAAKYIIENNILNISRNVDKNLEQLQYDILRYYFLVTTQ